MLSESLSAFLEFTMGLWRRVKGSMLVVPVGSWRAPESRSYLSALPSGSWAFPDHVLELSKGCDGFGVIAEEKQRCGFHFSSLGRVCREGRGGGSQLLGSPSPGLHGVLRLPTQTQVPSLLPTVPERPQLPGMAADPALSRSLSAP